MIKDKSIFIKNIYYMLAYAFEILNQGGYEDIAVEEFENIHNLFAAILAKGIGRQLKQGLYREYIDKKEDIAVVRGKIDMPGTIRDRLARKRVLTCEYDELSENNGHAPAPPCKSGTEVQRRAEKRNAFLLRSRYC